MSLDYRTIKEEFPILRTQMNGKPLVFLDSAASSQKPQRVIDAFSDYYRCRNANIHRGAYRLSYEATDLYDQTRRRIARFLGAAEPETCIFTRNTTESINLVASAWGDTNVGEGDEIVVSELEHHSNLVPWMMLAQRRGAKLRHIPLTDDGHYDYDRLDEVLSPRTRIVAAQHMSNVLGSIHDIKQVTARAHAAGATVLVDGAQGACHLPVNVADIDCDFYALSAHKMLGPTGVGVLYGKRKILESMPPFLGGGDMILTVSRDSFEPAPLPAKFEAGTPNIAGVVAYAIALDYLEKIGIENIHAHEKELLRYAVDELERIPGITLREPESGESRRGCLV